MNNPKSKHQTSKIMFVKSLVVTVFLIHFLLRGQVYGADLQSLSGQGLKLTPEGEMNVLLAPAREALGKGNLPDCRTLAASAVNKYTDLPHPDVLIASWLLEASELHAAQQILEEVALSQSARPDIHYLFANLAMKQNQSFHAWVQIQAAETTEPPSTWSKVYCEQMATNIQMTKAMIADHRGDWKTSRRILTQLKVKSPLDVRLELGLGRAAFHLGEREEAESHFVAAAKLDHEQVPELIMASLYDSKGETKQVELWLEKGERPNYPFVNRVRLEHARWLIRQAKPSQARETAIKGSPDKNQKVEFDFLLAIADQMEGKHDEAERTLTRLHQENPSNPLISNHLAWSLVESSDEGKRGRALQIVTSNAKNSLDAVVALAWVQFRLGDVRAAANATTIAIKQGGTLSRDSAFFLGKICEAVGGETESSRLLNAARTSNGEFINAYRLK